MGMLKMDLDDPAVIRRRRRGTPRVEAQPTTWTPRGPRRATLEVVDVRSRLSGGI